MAEFILERHVKAHADIVWSVISDVAAYADVAPHIRKVEILDAKNGQVTRRCYDHGDKMWVERSVEWVDRDHYTMEVDAPRFSWLLSSLRATYGLTTRGDSSEIRLRYEFSGRFGLLAGLAEQLFVRQSLRHSAIALIDNLVGLVRKRELGYKVTVGTILRRKGSEVATVPEKATLAEVAAVLHERRIGCVMVTEQGADSSLRGLCSERDIVNAVDDHGAGALSLPVSDVMATELVVAAPDNDMFFIMACMSERRIRHLPVIDEGRLVGIISIGDVVKERIDSLEAESETMREYIAGRAWRYHHQVSAAAPEIADGHG